jgi:hypothetical protein
VLIVVLTVLGAAYLTARPEHVEDRVLTPEIPSLVAGDGASVGRLLLTVQEAELHIEPIEAGEPLRVLARYDTNAFALDGELGAGEDGGTAWIYRATFGRAEQAGLFSGLVSVLRGSTARIDVFLPRGVPLDLVLTLNEGAAVLRLGGLWLETAEIEIESVALDMAVDEPMPEPMKSLSIRTTKGGVVHLPSGVVLEGLERHGVEAVEASESDQPTSKFSVTTSLGWLEFSDYVNRGRMLDLPEPVRH